MTSSSDQPEMEDVDPPRPTVDPSILERAADLADSANALTVEAPATEQPTAEVVPSDAPLSGGEVSEVPDDDDLGPPPTVDVSDPDAAALSAIPLATRIEAALFATTEPLPLKKLKELTGCLDGRLVRETLDELAASYTAQDRAFRVDEVAQGFQFRTTADVAIIVQRLGRRPADEKLSTAALETLAVVAYRQPVLRVDIERIRGVACGEVLRALQERGLVRVAARADLPGSPILYGTTQRFLEIFGLRALDDLPKDREILRRPD